MSPPITKQLHAMRLKAHPFKVKMAKGEMDIDRLNAQHKVPEPRQNTNRTRETQG